MSAVGLNNPIIFVFLKLKHCQVIHGFQFLCPNLTDDLDNEDCIAQKILIVL
jgi:hypothetical protein